MDGNIVYEEWECMSNLDTIFVNVCICESVSMRLCVKYSGILCVIEKTSGSKILNIPCTCMDRRYIISSLDNIQQIGTSRQSWPEQRN